MINLSNYTEAEKRYIQDNSLERVLNTTIRIIEGSKHPDAVTNLEDLTDLKAIASKCWNDIRNEIFLTETS